MRTNRTLGPATGTVLRSTIRQWEQKALAIPRILGLLSVSYHSVTNANTCFVAQPQVMLPVSCVTWGDPRRQRRRREVIERNCP